jgi:hypothetical protein
MSMSVPCGISLAQTVPEDTASEGGYETTIAAALREFQEGRFPEARALFERAHALRPSARTLRGIGVAAFEMRDYPHAWVSLRAALEHPVLPLSDEQRADLSALLVRIDLFLSRLELVNVPAGAQVHVDGRAAVMVGTQVIVGPGTHTVSIEAEGMRTRSHTIESVSGTTQRIVVELVPLAPTTIEPPLIIAIPSGSGEQAQRAPTRGPWTFLGIGAAAVVTLGVPLGVVGYVNAVDETADPGRARRLGYAADTLMGVGIAAGVGSLVWRYVARRAEPSVSVSPAVRDGEAMLVVGGTF